MARLLRLAFSSIGHRDARLDPVVLDLRGPAGGGVDSVVWLRNGGGKTSLINLFFSLFRPSRAEFLGSTAEGKARRIGDYVKGGDLSFVVSEWDVAPERDGAPREIRLVGQVLAWKGGQASADQGKLQRLWFSLRAGSWIAFDALPIRGLGAGLGSFERFRDWLREEAQARPGAEVTATEHQRSWVDHLEKLGLDPELFRYQLEMNKREGAADEVFRFASAADFIRFLLALAFESGRADQVVGNLGELREQLTRRPLLQRELGFLGQALGALEPLAAAVREREAARVARAAALAGISALCAAAEQRRAELDDERAAALARADGADERVRQAQNERDKLQRWARGLELRGLELEVAEAEAARAEAADHVLAAEGALAAARAGEKLADVQRARATAGALREALARSALELAPLVRALGRAGAALRGALAGERQRLGSELADVEGRIGLADATLRRQRAEVEESSRRAGELSGRRRALEERLARRDRERERLIRDGWLEPREGASDGLARWAADGEAARLRADDAEAGAAGARRRQGEIAARTAELTGEMAEQRAEAARLWADHEAAIAWRDRLAQAPLLAALEGSDLVDLGAAGLEGRVRRRADGLERELLAHAVESADDRQALRALEETGLLPPAREVDQVCRALRERGEVAHAGPGYLAENLAPDRVAPLLAGDPARFGGVVVLSEAGLDAARELGAAVGLRAPVQVSRVEASDLVPRAPPDRAVVVAPAPALYDRRAAEARRVELEALGSERERTARGLAEERRIAEGLADELHRYVEAHGAGKLEALERAAALADGRRDRAARELGELGAERTDLAARLAELERLAAVGARAVVRAEAACRALGQFLEEHDAPSAGTRDQLDEVARSIRDIERRRAELAELIERSERGLEDLREERRDRRLGCEACEAEERSVAYRDEEPDAADGPGRADDEGDGPPGSLDQARIRYKILLEEHDRRFSQDKRRWQLEQIEEELAQLGRQLSALSNGVPPAAIAEVAGLPDPAAEVVSRQAGHERAGQRASDARAALREATRRLDEARRRRDAADLPADRPAPRTSAAAREAAEEVRIEAQASAESSQRHAQEGAAARARGLELERAGAELERVPAGLRALVEGAALELPASPPSALPDGAAAVTALAAELRRRFAELRAAADAAEAAVQGGAEQVRRLAGAAEHAELRAQYRERMKDGTEELAAGAARLAIGLEERRTVIAEQLAAIERDRAILLDSLVSLGDDAERFLQRTARASVMPAGLGAWADRPYLRIEFQFPGSAEERRARIEPLVDRLIDRARLDGHDLVREVVTELAGARGFEVRILKPDAVLRPEPVPIAAITTFSRGQQLTAAILLYCTLVQMRARTRGRSSGAIDAGMLLLDNPIGTCSSVPLLQLQRRVASQMRVQLVYATGVDDLEALDTLPNKIRLRNAHRDRATGDQHVTLEGQLEAVRVVERAAT